MKSSLQTLQRIQKFNIDEQRKILAYLQYREAFERQLAAVRTEIEKVRDKIADMFKEQKTFEIVDDNRQKRREKENNAKEQKTLDEIGTNAYIKRKKQ